MKVARVQTRQVTVTLDKPIGSALGEIRSFGCVLVFVHDDGGGMHVAQQLVQLFGGAFTIERNDYLASLQDGQDTDQIFQ